MLKKSVSAIIVLTMLVSLFSATPLSVAAEEISYCDTGSSAALENDDLAFIGNNSLGTMLAAEYDKNSEDTEPSGCGIYSVEVEGKTARADVRVLTDSRLIVAIFDEDGQNMYGSGISDVTAEDSIVELPLELDTIPEYFTVKAFLIDKLTDLPLCKQYETDRYTQRMHEFFSKTVDDFDEAKVLNLDDSDEENFLVYDSDTVIIESGDTNKVTKSDRNTKEYVIENIDESVSSLKPDDIFSCDLGDNKLLIIKIISINITGSTAFIIGEEPDLEEAFDYIRIDTSHNAGEVEVDNSALDDDVTCIEYGDDDLVPTGWELIDSEFEASTELNYKFDIKEHKNEQDTFETNNKNSVSLNLKLSVDVKCYYDAHLFQDDEVEFSFTLKYELGASLDLKLSGKLKRPLGYLTFMPIPAVTVSFTPSLVLSGKVEAKFSLKTKGQIGKAFKNGFFEDLYKAPQSEFSLKLKAEVFIGLSLVPEIAIAGGIIKAKAEAEAGVKIKAELEYSTDSIFDKGDTKHLCTSCVEGEIFFVAEISVELSLLDADWMRWNNTLAKFERKITDFYYSFDTNKFGFTKCPNKSYKIRLTLFDNKYQPIINAYINDLVSTDSNGMAELYLKAGSQILTIKKSTKTVQRSISVSTPSSHRLIIDFNKPEGNTTGSFGSGVVVNKSRVILKSGYCGSDVKYTLFEDGILEISGSGDMYREGEAPWRSLRDSISTVIIWDGVTSIGGRLFSDCTNLTSIIIPNSVTVINKNAFTGCISLISIDIPNSVTRIDDYAFFDCTNLKSVNIPTSVSTINSFAFGNCKSLSRVVIPDSVTHLGGHVFYGCTNLTSVILPDSISYISGGAFSGCSILTSILIPGSITSIGESAFENCSNLTYLEIPNSVTSIGHYAFRNCTSLSSIRIPESVTSLGRNVFYNCSNLENVIIPNSITTLSPYLFAECTSLDNVNIGQLSCK